MLRNLILEPVNKWSVRDQMTELILRASSLESNSFNADQSYDLLQHETIHLGHIFFWTGCCQALGLLTVVERARLSLYLKAIAEV